MKVGLGLEGRRLVWCETWVRIKDLPIRSFRDQVVMPGEFVSECQLLWDQTPDEFIFIFGSFLSRSMGLCNNNIEIAFCSLSLDSERWG